MLTTVRAWVAAISLPAALLLFWLSHRLAVNDGYFDGLWIGRLAVLSTFVAGWSSRALIGSWFDLMEQSLTRLTFDWLLKKN